VLDTAQVAAAGERGRGPGPPRPCYSVEIVALHQKRGSAPEREPRLALFVAWEGKAWQAPVRRLVLYCPGKPVEGVRGVMEPQRASLRVTGVKPVPDDLAEFYVSAYPRVLRVVSAMADGVEDAEGCVQDAFVQLLPRWRRVQWYDDPEAWVRQVAVRRLISSHRRRQVAARALPRLAQTDVAPEPDGDRVDIDGVLARLTPDARAVLVLHHGLGMPLPEVADVLGVPVGTVKSRLHRARAAFTSQYPNAEVSRA